MANDPGWGQRNDKGPPDLDEVMRDLHRKLGTFLGRTSQSSNISKIPLILIVLALVFLVWMVAGFYLVDQGSRGIVFRFGRPIETTLPGPRWHIPYPIETVNIVNLERIRTLEVGYRTSQRGSMHHPEPKESLMLTGDENIVDLQFSIQYKLKNAEDFLFHYKSSEKAVRALAQSVMREVVGQHQLEFVLHDGRESIASNSQKRLQAILDRDKTGIQVLSINLHNVQAPEQVRSTFEDVVKAKQDLEKQIIESQSFADEVISKAQATASTLLQEAEGNRVQVESEARDHVSQFNQILARYSLAPEVKRQQLYLEAQAQIISNVKKVDDKDKQNKSLLRMSLDQLLSSSKPSKSNMPLSESTVNEASLGDSRSREDARIREREVR
jgi:modulator of FtsH protease HflK